MKKLKLILFGLNLTGAVFSLAACNDDKDDNTQPTKDTLSVDPRSHLFDAADNDPFEFKVETSANTFVAKVNNADENDWLQIDHKSGSFLVTVDDFEDEDATTNRVATITVSAGNADAVQVTITQKFPGSPEGEYTLTLEEDELEFEAYTELTKRVRVITEILADDITVAITKGNTWIQNARIVAGYLEVTVAGNDTDAVRDGIIELDSPQAEEKAVLTVLQNPAPPVTGIDIEGEWTLTGYSLNDEDDASYDVTITYSAQYEGYLVGPIDYSFGEDIISAHILLQVEEDEVFFYHGKYMGEMYHYDTGMGLVLDYYIINDVVLDDQDELVPADYVVQLNVSDDMNTITAPSTVVYNDEEFDLFVGFGMVTDLASVGENIVSAVEVLQGFKLERR